MNSNLLQFNKQKLITREKSLKAFGIESLCLKKPNSHEGTKATKFH
jgi:hypothetical protein